MTAGLVDSHAHFDVFAAEGGVQDVLRRAHAAGVGRIVAIGGSPEANRLAADLATRHAGRVFAAVGFDRHLAARPPEDRPLEALAAAPGVVAVGETGLDYHYEPGTRAAQCALFERMLDLAERHHLPVVVHAREADGDLLPLLREHARRWSGSARRLGVVHCFTGTKEVARAVVDTGYHVGFSGIVTFRNAASVREAAASVPDDCLLVETDAPYLAPVPFRGRRNEPSFLPHTVAALAEVRRCDPAQLAAVTARNAECLFGLGPGLPGGGEGVA